MQRVHPILMTTLLASLAASPLLAQEQPPTGSPADAFMGQLDTDGDGKVNLEEAVAPQKARFSETDANSDGLLDAAEAGAAFKAQVPPEMIEAMNERGMPDPGETFIKNLDQNADGQVDPSEFEQPTAASFKRMDADGDGYATKDEATAFFDEMQRQMQEQMQRMQEQQAADGAPAPAQPPQE
jgi:Ca2+-binding EF-hand superfamily protein